MVRAPCVARDVLGMASKVHDIVRTVDLDCDGLVSWDEFKRAFHDPGETCVFDVDVPMHVKPVRSKIPRIQESSLGRECVGCRELG